MTSILNVDEQLNDGYNKVLEDIAKKNIFVDKPAVQQYVIMRKGGYAYQFNLEPVYLNLFEATFNINGFDDSVNEILNEELYAIEIMNGEVSIYFEDNLDITNETLVDRYLDYACEHTMENPIDITIKMSNKKGDVFKQYDYKGGHIAARNFIRLDYGKGQEILKPFIVVSDWESIKILPEYVLYNGNLIQKKQQ